MRAIVLAIDHTVTIAIAINRAAVLGGVNICRTWLIIASIGNIYNTVKISICIDERVTGISEMVIVLICLIGVAVIKPAEFVIFRIGQKTAEAQS